MIAMDFFFASYVVLWLVVIINVMLLTATLRTVGLTLSRLPAPAALALDDQGPAIGETVPSDVLGRFPSTNNAGRTAIVFLSTTCALCRNLAPSISAVRTRGHAAFVLIKGEPEEAKALFDLLGRDAERYARIDADAFRLSHIDATPFAVVIDEKSMVVSKGLVNTLQHLESLFVSPRGVSV